MTVKNSKGTVFYGMHMYPGVAEYQEPAQDPYRIFLNEDTIRAMDPSFAGRPVFVMHVDGVDDNLDELRKEADGWVVESFYNQADGKHWVKFIVVTEKGMRAIKNGMRLSNCYVPRGPFGSGGLWNGVSYTKEVKGGEYEHLAIVPNPRYEESVIMSPEEFKQYNEVKVVELKRLANSHEEKPVKLNLFKRTKVENSTDLEGVMVVLPKSGKEMSIVDLVANVDERLSNSPMAAHPEHLVDMGEGTKMTVNDLMAKHKAVCDELTMMKAKNAEAEAPDEEGDPSHGDVDLDSPASRMDNEDDDMEDVDAEDKKKEKKNKKENKDDDKDAEKEEKAKNDIAAAAAKKANAKAKAKADDLRNAERNAEPPVRIELMRDQVARGKSRYGS